MAISTLEVVDLNYFFLDGINLIKGIPLAQELSTESDFAIKLLAFAIDAGVVTSTLPLVDVIQEIETLSIRYYTAERLGQSIPEPTLLGNQESPKNPYNQKSTSSSKEVKEVKEEKSKRQDD